MNCHQKIFQYLRNIGKLSLLSFAAQNDDSGSHDVFRIVVVHNKYIVTKQKTEQMFGLLIHVYWEIMYV